MESSLKIKKLKSIIYDISINKTEFIDLTMSFYQKSLNGLKCLPLRRNLPIDLKIARTRIGRIQLVQKPQPFRKLTTKFFNSYPKLIHKQLPTLPVAPFRFFSLEQNPVIKKNKTERFMEYFKDPWELETKRTYRKGQIGTFIFGVIILSLSIDKDKDDAEELRISPLLITSFAPFITYTMWPFCALMIMPCYLLFGALLVMPCMGCSHGTD